MCYFHPNMSNHAPPRGGFDSRSENYDTTAPAENSGSDETEETAEIWDDQPLHRLHHLDQPLTLVKKEEEEEEEAVCHDRVTAGGSCVSPLHLTSISITSTTLLLKTNTEAPLCVCVSSFNDEPKLLWLKPCLGVHRWVRTTTTLSDVVVWTTRVYRCPFPPSWQNEKLKPII